MVDDKTIHNDQKSYSKTKIAMGLVVIVVIVVIVLVVLWETGVLFQSKGSSCTGDKPDCVDSNGKPVSSTCPDGQTTWQCPQKSCDKSAKPSCTSGATTQDSVDAICNENTGWKCPSNSCNNNDTPANCIALSDGSGDQAPISICDGTDWVCPNDSCNATDYKNTCDPSDQLCQSGGTFACYCPSAGASKQNTPEDCQGESGSSVTCSDTNGWVCMCGNPGEKDTGNCTSGMKGQLTCGLQQANSQYQWMCECGSNDMYADISTLCPPTYGQGEYTSGKVTVECDSTGTSLVCKCNETAFPDTSNNPCDDGQYLCTDDGWVCISNQEACGSDQTDPGCGSTSQKKCNATKGKWYCSDQCDLDGEDNACTQDPTIFNDSSITRAIYSLNCSTADNITQCMEDGRSANVWMERVSFRNHVCINIQPFI